jgi:hypothetical protein
MAQWILHHTQQKFFQLPMESVSQRQHWEHGYRFNSGEMTRKLKPRRPVKDDAAMAVLLPGGPTPNSYAARRTSFNATLSFAFRFLTR